jgi:photosystem II stability/assembly factor-like uncharacterized protein
MKKSRSEKDLVDTIRNLPQKHKLSPESRERILIAIRREYQVSAAQNVRSRRSVRNSPFKKWKAPLVSAVAMGLVVLIGFALWKSSMVQPQTNISSSKLNHTIKKMDQNHPLSAPTHKKETNTSKTKTNTNTNTQDNKQKSSLNQLQSNINDIKMVNEQIGWVQAGNQILYTQDSGHSWQNVTPKALATQKTQDPIAPKAEFYDAKNAWVVVFTQAGSSVYHTQDGGKTWKESPIKDQGMMGGPITLTFNSQNEGWLLLADGAGAGSELVSLFHTSDGGSTWDSVGATQPNSNQKDPLPLGGMKSGLSVNLQSLWLSGLDASDYPYLYKSEDMGVHWKVQTVPIPNGYSAAGGSSETFPPHFFNQSEGIMPVKFGTLGQPYVFYLTHDGGQTWRTGTGVKSSKNNQMPYQIIDDHHIAVLDTNSLYISSDQGQSWKSIQLMNPLDEINFINPSVGFGYHGKIIYKTVDGGKTWTPLAP